jgi:hypothetical protein
MLVATIANVLIIAKTLVDAWIYAARNKEIRVAIYTMQARVCHGHITSDWL